MNVFKECSIKVLIGVGGVKCVNVLLTVCLLVMTFDEIKFYDHMPK